MGVGCKRVQVLTSTSAVCCLCECAGGQWVSGGRIAAFASSSPLAEAGRVEQLETLLPAVPSLSCS